MAAEFGLADPMKGASQRSREGLAGGARLDAAPTELIAIFSALPIQILLLRRICYPSHGPNVRIPAFTKERSLFVLPITDQ
jgi:hypothetical protein